MAHENFSESSFEHSHFIFLNEYEEERLDEFIDFVLTTLNTK